MISTSRLVLLAALVLCAGLLASCGHKAGPDSPAPWPKSVTDKVATVPVLSQGRIKPLDTWAAFTLLRMNGVRSCRDADNNVLNPREWALDALFRPLWASKHRCFLIVTDEVLDAIELKVEGRKKRDRYSYEELRPALDKISRLGRRHMEKETQERTPVEEGLVRLFQDLHEFTALLSYMDFTRTELRVNENPEVAKLFDGREAVVFTEILPRGTELVAKARAMVPVGSTPETAPADAKALTALLEATFQLGAGRTILRLFPPIESSEAQPTWYHLTDLTQRAMLGGGIAPEHLAMLRDFEAIAAAGADPSKALMPLTLFHDASRSLAEKRGEYDKIEQEVSLYKLDPFNRSLYLYLLAFVCIALTWLKPGMKWFQRTAWFLLVAGLALHTYGIVLRCIIRGRPPISTLYETVIFIIAVAVLTLLIVERFNKRRVALALAPIIGVVGLFIAGRYEVLNRSDTMPRLQAVLDTNFWLMTHVTCISIGYCAGLLAGFVAHVYVLGRFFQGRNAGRVYSPVTKALSIVLLSVLTFAVFNYFGGLTVGIVSTLVVGGLLWLHFRGVFLPTAAVDQEFYRTVGRMVYGLICFALLFSLVGTILGGVWANDSWGRFWGWDPKENGALLICLVQIATLHGRMGGILKIFGVCMAAIFGAVVVAFSWWGVNLLGIGLHSYGFTSGIWSALIMFYAVEALVLGAGLHAWLRDRKADPSVKTVRAETTQKTPWKTA